MAAYESFIHANIYTEQRSMYTCVFTPSSLEFIVNYKSQKSWSTSFVWEVLSAISCEI